MNEISKKVDCVEIVDELTYTIIWMSMRYWISGETKKPWFQEYPYVLTLRFWDYLTENQRRRLLEDVKREKEMAFDKISKKRSKLLQQEFDLCNKELNEPNRDVYNEPNTDKKFDEIDFDMLRMALLYACPRKTIASTTLPEDIVKHRFKLFSEEQIKTIINDLNNYLDWKENHFGKREFSDSFDDKTWKKFLKFLDDNSHYNVKGIDDKIYKTFLSDGIYYSYDRFLEQPYIDCYIEEKNIVEISELTTT